MITIFRYMKEQEVFLWSKATTGMNLEDTLLSEIA